MPRLAGAYDVGTVDAERLSKPRTALRRQIQRRAILAQLNVGKRRLDHRHFTVPAGEGCEFAQGSVPANYQTFTGTFPTANVFFADNLESPLTREFTVAVARDLGNTGWARATYVKRHAANFVEDFITLADGQTTISRNGVNLGAFDNAVYRNSDLPKRDYQALQFESVYRRSRGCR